MARLFADENFPLPVTEELRRLGHDVLKVQEAGKAEQSWPDDAVLEFASQETRAVLTLNRKHFRRLHQARPEHAGIVLCTFDPDFVGQAGRIHEAISPLPSLANQVVRVNRPSR